jgi:uncharacterized RDD family membrane protein YckC
MADGYPPPPPGWFAFHPPPPAPRWAGYRLAGFWLRAGGYAVDASITALFTLPAMIVFFAGPWRTRDCSFPEDPFCEVPAAGTIAATVVLWLSAMAGIWAYHALAVARRGATPGGRLVGCQVVDLGTGRWPSLPKALGRHAFAVFVSGYFYWIGYLWMLWDPARQTLHDKVCDTVVVET